MRRAIAAAYFLAALTLTPKAYAQDCAAPKRCVTAQAVNDAADRLCRRARAKELEFDGLRNFADTERESRLQCEGRELELRAQADYRADVAGELARERFFTTIGTVAGYLAGGLAVGTAWAFLEDAPAELRVATIVGWATSTGVAFWAAW